MHNDVIHLSDAFIGYSWDIAWETENELKKGTIDEIELAQEVIEKCKEHDGLVICRLHPMGAVIVNDLVEV